MHPPKRPHRISILGVSLLIVAIGGGAVAATASGEEEAPLVQIKQGTLAGTTLTSRRGSTYFAFLGIPYGKIPQRFEAPEPADRWDGVKEVKGPLPPPCPLYNVLTKEIQGVEDCLVLNVYTPRLPTQMEEKGLPVIVWFSPGGYQMGGASFFKASYIMDHPVLFVSLNNRLGALGFLNTGEDGVVGGNAGLKDQALALRWVKENIAAFGGDPHSVTIAGLSAGSSSVEYMILSPMGKGLFHRAIGMSGSALNPWAFQEEPAKVAEEWARHAGCWGEGEGGWVERVECLRKKDFRHLIQAQIKLMHLGQDFDFLHMKFVPSIESPSSKGPHFLTRSPYELLSTGSISSKVPTILGYTENEGSLYIGNIMEQPSLIRKINEDFIRMAPYLFYYEGRGVVSERRISEKIWEFYFGEEKLGSSSRSRRAFSNIYTDRFFANGIAQSIQLHAKHNGAVYPYVSTHAGNTSLIRVWYGAKEGDGFAHADELIYMFDEAYGAPYIQLGTKDGEFSEKLLSVLATFAKDGKVKGWGNQRNWPPQDPKGPLFLYKLELETTSLIRDELEERRAFWDSLELAEHGKGGKTGNKDEL